MSVKKEDHLKEVRKKIAIALSDMSVDQTRKAWEISALQYCLDIIEELQEENNALWFMLEELKNSNKWTQKNTDELNETITNHLKILRLMQTKKGDA